MQYGAPTTMYVTTRHQQPGKTMHLFDHWSIIDKSLLTYLGLLIVTYFELQCHSYCLEYESLWRP